jgi:hypothetical protein
MTQPRRFHLQRTVDITGASGTGRVADGVLWPDGTLSIRWPRGSPGRGLPPLPRRSHARRRRIPALARPRRLRA